MDTFKPSVIELIASYNMLCSSGITVLALHWCTSAGIHHFLHKFHVVIAVAVVAVAGVGRCHRTRGAFTVDRSTELRARSMKSGQVSNARGVSCGRDRHGGG